MKRLVWSKIVLAACCALAIGIEGSLISASQIDPLSEIDQQTALGGALWTTDDCVAGTGACPAAGAPAIVVVTIQRSSRYAGQPTAPITHLTTAVSLIQCTIVIGCFRLVA